MKFYSTKNKSRIVDFKEAVLYPYCPEGGLYMPLEIPRLSRYFFENIFMYSFCEMALEVASAFIGDIIPKGDLKQIIDKAINFDVSLKFLSADTVALELFDGPSLTSQDFGMRFMAGIMNYFAEKENKQLNIIAIGDKNGGFALVLRFSDVQNLKLTVLYPKSEISKIQKQPEYADNIRIIEVDGSFEECSNLLDEVLADEGLNFISPDTANIAFLLGQSFVYFYAFAMLKSQGVDRMVLSLPEGDFSDTAAALLAWQMGLPVFKFVAAENKDSGEAAKPKNWTRITEMFDGDSIKLERKLAVYNFSDEEVVESIDILNNGYNYRGSSATALAFMGTQKFKTQLRANYASVFIAPQHPDMLSNEANLSGREAVNNPEFLKSENHITAVHPDFEEIKQILLAAE